jgi:hypothetical protein
MSTTQISEAKVGASYWHRQFQLQQNMKDVLQAQLRSAEGVIAEAKALHRESKWSETVSYCVMCAERWPCESDVILTRLDNDASDTVNRGDGL